MVHGMQYAVSTAFLDVLTGSVIFKRSSYWISLSSVFIYGTVGGWGVGGGGLSCV